jgi:integrase
LCSLRWAQIDLRHGRLHVNRAKGGVESVHPLHGPELRALRPLQGSSPYVLVTEAGTPVTTAWFLRMLQRTGSCKAPLCRPSSHVASCLRIQARQRWPRYSLPGALSRSSQFAIYCAIYRTSAG